jgi:membrane-associated phospholipid phosphatase
VLALLKAHWPLKLALTLLLNAFFWTGYSILGRVAFFSLHAVPITALDRWVPFQPEPWGWIYLSQFVAVGWLPWLLNDRQSIYRYTAGVLIMSVVSFAVFLFFPTPGPRPGEFGDSVSMRMIASYDGTMNACPSLHAAFLAYMVLLAWRMFGHAAPWRTLGIAGLWGVAILYSTLATKQHYALDLAAGTVLGVLADRLAWRGSTSSAVAAMTIPRSSGSRSQAGVR